MLKDLKKKTRKIEFRGQEVELQAVSLSFIESMFDRFPNFGKTLSGNIDKAPNFASWGADIICAIIAAGFGEEGDSDAERSVRDYMTPDEILEVFMAIYEISVPNGMLPFVQAGTKIGLLVPQQA
jgi:hypothetical protein